MTKANSLTVDFIFRDDAMCSLYGQQIKLWVGCGLPDFEGTLDTFKELYPLYFAELLRQKIIKPTA